MRQRAQRRLRAGIGALQGGFAAAIVAGLVTGLVAALLAGCTLGAGGGDGAAAPGSAGLVRDAITVTPLEAPAPADAAGAAPAATAATQPEKEPAPDAATQPQKEPAADAALAPEEPAPPPRSPEEIACARKGGDWVGTGQSGARACVRPTRDGGKRCSRESQCEGFCLARSGTCAPVTPLFGCNDILQDNGVMVTLCID